MDKERARDLKRINRFSPSTRQQRALSGHIIHNNTNNSLPFSLSALVDKNDNDGGGDGNMLDRFKKEKVRGTRWDSGNEEDSEMEEAYVFRRTLTTTTTPSLSSRKKVKIHGKGLEDHNAVDPAVVPRKLRSAINKRRSPPLLGSKKKHHHASNRTTQVPYVNGARTFKQNTLYDSITKDEEEAAETLSALAGMVPVIKPTKSRVDRRMSEEKSETKATTSTSLSEASEEEDTNFSLPCTGTETLKTKPVAEPAVLEQPSTISGSQKFGPASSETAQPEFQRTPLLCRNEQAGNTSSSDAMNSSNPLGMSTQFHSENGALQPTQLDALPVQKSEIGLCPLGPAAVEHELKPESGAHCAFGEETTHDLRLDLPNCAHGLLGWSSSSTDAVWADSATCSTRPSSTGINLPTEKLSLVLADTKQSWNKCATHVYISHLIQMKHKEGMYVTEAKDKAGLRNASNSIASSGTKGSANTHEARIPTLQDGRLLRAQQASTLSGTYAQKKQGCYFSAMSVDGEPNNPRNGVKSSGQHHLPFLHPRVPYHAIMPLSFPHGPYSSAYVNQLTAAAAQQLQLPHYLGNPHYLPHMSHAGGPTNHQQQQMWQAHLAHYNPPLGIQKWQSRRPPHDSSPSLLPCTQAQFTTPPPSLEMLSGGCHLPNPPAHPGGFDEGCGFRPEGSSQLQLLCNAQHM